MKLVLPHETIVKMLAEEYAVETRKTSILVPNLGPSVLTMCHYYPSPTVPVIPTIRTWDNTMTGYRGASGPFALFLLVLVTLLLGTYANGSRSGQSDGANKPQVQMTPVKRAYSMQHHPSSSASNNYHDGHVLSKYLSIVGKMSTMDKGSLFTNYGDLPPAGSTVR